MTFQNPFAFILLLCIPVAILFLIWRNQVRQHALRQIGTNVALQQLIAQVSHTYRRIKSLLWLSTIIALIIALAHPIWGISAEIVSVEGTAILFLVDISRSMDAQDVNPSRLERAKLDLLRITASSTDNDIGIVIFAAEPFTYMPMTYDKNAVITFTNSLSTQATSRQGTNIYRALQLAVDTLSNYSVAEKYIIIMSDGENHVNENAESVQLAIDNQIIIHTVGYGTVEGSQIPLYDDNGNISGYQTDAGNAIVISRLETQALEEIAERTGGGYYTSESLNQLVDQLQSANDGELEQRTFTQPIQRFGIFLFLAFLLLSIEILIPYNQRLSR